MALSNEVDREAKSNNQRRSLFHCRFSKAPYLKLMMAPRKKTIMYGSVRKIVIIKL